MGKKKLFFRGESSNGFTDEYNAVLDYANSQGYDLPSETQQIIQNQLIIDLKLNGVWQKQDVLYITANDAGVDFSYINWIEPTLYTLQPDQIGVNIKNTNIDIRFSRPTRSFYNPSTHLGNFQLNNACIGYYTGSQVASSDTNDNYWGRFSGEASTNFHAVAIQLLTHARVWMNTLGTYYNFGDIGTDAKNTYSMVNLGRTNNNVIIYTTKNNKYIVKTFAPTGLANVEFYLTSPSCSASMSLIYAGAYLTKAEVDSFKAIYDNYLSAIQS